MIDAHLHFTDFLQDTDGVQKLFQSMDKAQITKAVLFGMPLVKKWEFYDKNPPHYYLDDNAKCYYFTATDEIVAEAYLQMTSQQQRRIAPSICGFNPTDMNCVKYIERLFDKYPFWQGVGEVLLRHDDLTNLTLGETPRANHPAMMGVYEFCASKQLPVVVHQNSTSIFEHDHFIYLEELTEVLAKFPSTTFIWAHCGVSRRVGHARYTIMLKDLLHKYSNLHLDIAWVVYDDMICDKSHNPKASWVKLINQFADRFCLGSDLLGKFDKIDATMSRYMPLIKALDKEAGQNIMYKNAERLWFS